MPEPTDWSTSSFCSGGTCVQVAQEPVTGDVVVRDSKHPQDPPLVFTRDEWEAFRAGVAAGEFGFGAALTPEEHYQRGVRMLQFAEEERTANRDREAQASAALAHGHFTASVAGASLRLFEVTTHPAGQVSVNSRAVPDA